MKNAARRQTPAALPLADRLPTFRELAAFDAGKAWDRLTREQQREIGMLAVRFGTIGQCEGYFHETLEAAQSGFMTAHWSPEAQAAAVWPRLHIDLVESAAQSAFQTLADHFDALWPQLFGWTARKGGRA
jgi:hypothetical protein